MYVAYTYISTGMRSQVPRPPARACVYIIGNAVFFIETAGKLELRSFISLVPAAEGAPQVIVDASQLPLCTKVYRGTSLYMYTLV